MMTRFLRTVAILTLSLALEGTLPLYAPQGPKLHDQTGGFQGEVSRRTSDSSLAATETPTTLAPATPAVPTQSLESTDESPQSSPSNALFDYVPRLTEKSMLADAPPPYTRSLLNKLTETRQRCELIIQTRSKRRILTFSPTQEDSKAKLSFSISGTDALCDVGIGRKLASEQHAQLNGKTLDDMFTTLTTWCENTKCNGKKVYSPLEGERDYILSLSAPLGSQELSDTLPPVEDLKSDFITVLYVGKVAVSADWLATLCDVMPSLKTVATKQDRLPERPFLNADHAEALKKITFYPTCEWHQLLGTQAYMLAQAEQAGTDKNAKDGSAS